MNVLLDREVCFELCRAREVESDVTPPPMRMMCFRRGGVEEPESILVIKFWSVFRIEELVLYWDQATLSCV